jgi:hypothetical protein
MVRATRPVSALSLENLLHPLTREAGQRSDATHGLRRSPNRRDCPEARLRRASRPASSQGRQIEQGVQQHEPGLVAASDICRSWARSAVRVFEPLPAGPLRLTVPLSEGVRRYRRCHVGSRRINAIRIPGGNFPDDGSQVTLDAFDELCAQDRLADLDVADMTLVRLRDPGTTPAVRDDWLARDLDVTDRPIPSSINAISDIRPVPVVVAVLAGLLGMAPAGQALLLVLRRRQG